MEGYCDFAASRAYYVMFYAVEALMLDRHLCNYPTLINFPLQSEHKFNTLNPAIPIGKK